METSRRLSFCRCESANTYNVSKAACLLRFKKEIKGLSQTSAPTHSSHSLKIVAWLKFTLQPGQIAAVEVFRVQPDRLPTTWLNNLQPPRCNDRFG